MCKFVVLNTYFFLLAMNAKTLIFNKNTRTFSYFYVFKHAQMFAYVREKQ